MKKLLEHLVTSKNIDNKLISSFQDRASFILGDFFLLQGCNKNKKTPGNKFLFLQIVFFFVFSSFQRSWLRWHFYETVLHLACSHGFGNMDRLVHWLLKHYFSLLPFCNVIFFSLNALAFSCHLQKYIGMMK